MNNLESKQLRYRWLYETYENDLFSYGMAFGLEKELLEDAVHDVFLYLYEHDHKLWESENIKFYLLNCLKNHIRTLKRKDLNWESLEDTNKYDFLIEVNGFELIEQEEERVATVRLLEEMLQSLTPRQREAVYLRFAQNLSFDEIAGLLGITTKGAQKLVYRAIEQMRENHPLLILFLLFGYFS